MRSRTRGPQKAERHDSHVQGAVLIVTVFIRLADLCRWGGSADRWGNKHLNGPSITSGGRWLAHVCPESGPDSCSLAPARPSLAVDRWICFCVWLTDGRIGKDSPLRLNLWGQDRERQASPNYSLLSVSHGAQWYTDCINWLWLQLSSTVSLIQCVMCIILDPYGNQGKNKETPHSSGFKWQSGNWIWVKFIRMEIVVEPSEFDLIHEIFFFPVFAFKVPLQLKVELFISTGTISDTTPGVITNIFLSLACFVSL